MNKQRELLQKVFDNIRSADLMLAGVYDEIVEELAKPEQYEALSDEDIENVISNFYGFPSYQLCLLTGSDLYRISRAIEKRITEGKPWAY